MIPTDYPAGFARSTTEKPSTGTAGRVEDPADGLAPVARRGARETHLPAGSPGRPSPGPPLGEGHLDRETGPVPAGCLSLPGSVCVEPAEPGTKPPSPVSVAGSRKGETATGRGRAPNPARGGRRRAAGASRAGQGEVPTAYWLVTLPSWPAAPAPADVLLNVRLNIPPVAASRPRVSPAEYTRIGGQKVKTKKAHAYNEKAYEDYKEKVGWLLKQAWGRRGRNDGDELGVYGIFHLPKRAGAADGDNLLKAILDAGNGLTWGDDRQFVRWAADVLRGSADPHTDLVVYIARARDGEAA